jgi:hypothetical protein
MTYDKAHVSVAPGVNGDDIHFYKQCQTCMLHVKDVCVHVWTCKIVQIAITCIAFLTVELG